MTDAGTPKPHHGSHSGNEGREAYSTVVMTHAVIQDCHRTGGNVHLATCGHERSAAKITNHQMQVVDANRPRVLPSHDAFRSRWLPVPAGPFDSGKRLGTHHFFC